MEGAAAIERALDLWTLIVRSQGQTPLSVLAAELSLPISTAHRIVMAFRRRGLITPASRGHYVGGLQLAALGALADPRATLIEAARPLLRRLARTMRTTVHMGMLEGDMVTYLVKEQGGGMRLFTQESMQLEAYCSAIGKVLLANAGGIDREAYLANGPFIALTEHTVTEPAALRDMLTEVRANDFAIDDREVVEDLHCIAVPMRDPTGEVIAAVSISEKYSATGEAAFANRLKALRDCSAAITGRLG